MQFVEFVLALSNEQVAFIGWVLGALFTLIFPFYLKIRAGKLTWSDFNIGYLINFILTIISGLLFSILIFAVWAIPEGSHIVIFITAFWIAAGLDETMMKRIIKALGVLDKLAGKLSG